MFSKIIGKLYFDDFVLLFRFTSLFQSSKHLQKCWIHSFNYIIKHKMVEHFFKWMIFELSFLLLRYSIHFVKKKDKFIEQFPCCCFFWYDPSSKRLRITSKMNQNELYGLIYTCLMSTVSKSIAITFIEELDVTFPNCAWEICLGLYLDVN